MQVGKDESRGCIYIREIGAAQAYPALEIVKEEIDQSTGQGTEECPHQDIAGIVDAQVDAAIGAQYGIGIENHGDPTVTEQQRQEYGNPEGIGRMIGEKAIQPAPIALYDVYDGIEFGIVRRPETVKKGLEESMTGLVGNGDEEGYEKQRKEKGTHPLVLEYHIGHNEHHRNPGDCLRDGPHESVEIQGIASIQK